MTISTETPEDFNAPFDWLLVADYKAEQGITDLTTKAWKTYRETHDLDIKNISGKWYVSRGQQLEEVEDSAPIETPAVKPSHVSFGDFSHSLAVVSGGTVGDINITSTNCSHGAIVHEAEGFVSQLGAFSEFLANTERMLAKRGEDLERTTNVKRQALQQVQLQVETIKQRALLAQREGIAIQVENEGIDYRMGRAVDLGKSLHSELSSLD